MKHEGEWRLVDDNQWTLESAALVCGQLACGAVLSIETKEMSQLNAWHVQLSCERDSMLRECSFIQPGSSYANLEVTCSGNNTNGCNLNRNQSPFTRFQKDTITDKPVVWISRISRIRV